MLDVKQAVQIASDYFASLYAPDAITELQLEEVELSEDECYWLITLGYLDKAVKHPVNAGLFSTTSLVAGTRRYKVFKIASDSGRVVSMKMREPDAAYA